MQLFYIYSFKKGTIALQLLRIHLRIFANYFFYSWWNIAYLPIILSSMLFNFVIGNTLSNTKLSLAKHFKQTQASDKSEVPNIASESRTCLRPTSNKSRKTFSKKSILIFGIVANISLLGYFKYADFFIVNFNIVSGSNASLLNFALFVTFFPQLIAGPIIHHKEMMPQFATVKNKVKNYRNIALGLFIFSIGLFKKVVIADTFAVWATAGFDTATTLNLFESWATSLSYTFQLSIQSYKHTRLLEKMAYNFE